MLQVVLDQPDGKQHVYHAGENVSGKVVYKVVVQEEIDNVSVLFKGNLLTAITTGSSDSRHRHVEKITLFRTQQVLFRGPYKLGAQVMEWPFEFRFPKTCSYKREGALIADEEASLPPTFRTSKRGGSAHEAVVEYKLKFHVNQGSFTRHQEQILPLRLEHLAPMPHPAPVLRERPFNYEIWSSRSLRAEKHTFKQSLTHVFSSNPELATPNIRFRASIHIPQALSRTQVVPLLFSLKHEKTGPTDPMHPTLELRNLSLELRATNNWISGKTLLSGNREQSSKDEIGRKYYSSLRKILPLDGTEVVVDEAFDMSKFPMLAGGTTPADFKTWTIDHKHQIKAVAQIVHVESNHLFETKISFPFQVLPSDSSNPPEPGLEDVPPPPFSKEMPPTQDVSGPAIARPSAPPAYGSNTGTTLLKN